MRFVHLVAHVRRGGPGFWDLELGNRLWGCLRRAFPDALAVTVMPDHVHVILFVSDVQAAHRRFRFALGGFAWGRGPIWEPIPPPKILPDVGKLRSDLRYVALNPCRRHYVADPLEWPWSTHRDLMGCAVDPWIQPERLAPLVRQRVVGFRESWHGYVSRDRDVRPEGTPAPELVPACETPAFSLDEIRRASVSARRCAPGDAGRQGATRDLFLALSRHQGWTSRSAVAVACGASTRTVRRARPVKTETLEAARRCLGDPRLVRWLDLQPGG
jgi:hypothetical protein